MTLCTRVAWVLALCLAWAGCQRDAPPQPSTGAGAGARASGGSGASRFLQRARSNDWVVIRGKVFHRLGPTHDKFVLPREPIQGAWSGKLLDGRNFDAMALSPDGRALVAMARVSTAPSEPLHFVLFDSGLRVVFEDRSRGAANLRGPQTRSAFRWSPDARYISYAQNKQIWLFDAQDHTFRTVAGDHQRDLVFTPPSWCADSSRLIYENEARQVAEVEIATGRSRVLTSGRFPACAPDGAWIVLRKASGDVSLLDRRNLKEKKIFSLPLHHPHYLWTPDSRAILLDQRVYNSYKSKYFVYALDAGELVDLGSAHGSLKGAQLTRLPGWLSERLRPVTL